MRYFLSFVIFAMEVCLASPASAEGKLTIEHAWIRAMPPNASMLAAYAQLHNNGDAPLTLIAAHSDRFAEVSLHESVERGGVVRMQSVKALSIAPGMSIALRPGGKHLMLMRPKRALALGDCVDIELDLGGGNQVKACFEIREDSPTISNH